MRALVALVIGIILLVPSFVLLQQPRGPWSLVWDALGLTFGLVGILSVLLALGVALINIIRR